MAPSIIAAIIGAIATVVAVLFNWWLQRGKKGTERKAVRKAAEPDVDDIYFMQFLLHDAYEKGEPLSTAELAVHHNAYSPLELEVKLLSLEKRGYVHRVSRKQSGLGSWQMSSKGVEFMFENSHQLQDLIEESRKNV